MGTLEILTVVLLVCVVLILALAIAIVFLLKRKNNNGKIEQETDRVIDSLGDLNGMIDKQIKNSQDSIIGAINISNSGIASMLQPYMKKYEEGFDKTSVLISSNLQEIRQDMTTNLREIREEQKESICSMRADIKQNLTDVQQDNSKQLEQMRQTVDEKLSTTLDKRIKSAFEIVNDRLDAVQKGFGEMNQLSQKVGDLNKVFSNVKTRGGWGEVALESLLEQILAPEQYKKQFRITPKNKEMVDFAIVMPGQAGERVYLPIDAKFPTADYEKLVDAVELANNEEIQKSRKALYDRIKTFAKSIKTKYINTPHTTNFAIMYLPTEGLYAEVVRSAELCSDLQNNHNILVCGPTTITALLNSLQVGFTTLRIQKSSSDIMRLMNEFRKDFENFTGLIDKVTIKAKDVVKNLDTVNHRNDIIKKKLGNVIFDAVMIKDDQKVELLDVASDVDLCEEDASDIEVYDED